MHRFYVDPDSIQDGLFLLSAEDLKHAYFVLRLKPDDRVEIVSGGCRWLSSVVEASSGKVSAEPLEQLPSTETGIAITLLQGLPKSDKMDLIVQKAVELGVTEIVPVHFSRCVVRYSRQDAEKKTIRWNRIAREAGKQSGRCVIPRVYTPLSLSEVPDFCAAFDAAVVPWEECRSGGPRAFAAGHPGISSLAVIIGPEGGIDPEEISLFRQSGITPLTLGKRILRTETAGMAAVSAFLSLYGEMG